MENTVGVSCKSCENEINMISRAFHITYYDNNVTHLNFFCKLCKSFNDAIISQEEILVLIAAGVAIDYDHVPSEALEEHTGPPLNEEDITDFKLSLELSETERS